MPFELSYQEVEELLESVINNKRLTKIQNSDGDDFVVFSHPNCNDILSSRFTREKALIEATKEELPTREEISQVIKSRGLIDNDAIEELERKVAAQKRVLSLTKIEARRSAINETIDKLSEEIFQLKSKGDDLYAVTREFRADEESLLYLAWAASFNLDGSRRWPSFQEFENETDLVLRISVIGEFSKFNRGLSTAEIRFLARHVLWRIRYTAGLKIGGPLFPQGLHDLTPDQQSLLYWSNYYQSIYEMLPDDQPDDDTINDDEALDAYMEAYFKRREQERNDGRLKRRSGGKGKLSAESSDEVIVTTNHPDYLQMAYSDRRVNKSTEGAEVEVVAPNSRRARNRRAARRNK